MAADPGSYVAGVGVNSVLPARGGDVAKIYLAKQSIPNSTYPAVTSSFFVESVFDIPVGSLVMLFALTQGVLPSLAEPARPGGLRPRRSGRTTRASPCSRSRS